MFDRKKTIQQALSKYKTIFPINGKHTLEECFFCLRGEYRFVFKTKDKKMHTMKARLVHKAHEMPRIDAESFSALFKLINKPIIVRSLIIKKPVKACLINLFPVPGISWSRNEDVAEIKTSYAANRQVVLKHAKSGVEQTSAIADAQADALRDKIALQLASFSGVINQPQLKKNFYHLEVIAPGCFPVIIEKEMFVAGATPPKKVESTPFAWPVGDRY